jgi:uncharacterized protein YdaU (DUF1376 family)
MAKDPAFLFYYQDFLVGIDHMTDEQVGQYIKLLCHQANRGTIREQHMQSICKDEINLKVVSEKFIVDSNGEYYNKRLREETDKRKKYTDSRRKNATSHEVAYAKHMEDENENEDVNENKDKDKIKPSDFDFEIADKFICRAKANFKSVNPDRDKFAHSVRLLRSDGLTEETILKITEYLKTRPDIPKDKFCWFDQIGTPEKLRHKTRDGQFRIWEKVLHEIKSKPQTMAELIEEGF